MTHNLMTLSFGYLMIHNLFGCTVDQNEYLSLMRVLQNGRTSRSLSSRYVILMYEILYNILVLNIEMLNGILYIE